VRWVGTHAVDQIDLWLVAQDDVRDTELLGRYRELLTDDERAQERRFHFLKDQHQYLITRALVRTVLSRYTGVPPHVWRFSKNAHGRPEVGAPHAAIGQLAFNLSHTRELVICAVAHGRMIGVDTENLTREGMELESLERCFAPPELEALRVVPRAMQPACLFEYWTMKEAYMKARGQGLSIPPEHIVFDLTVPAAVRVSLHPSLGDDAGRWHFWLLKPTRRHLVAVCASDARRATLRLRQVVPLVADEACEYSVVRQSPAHAMSMACS
jgi:4'-phosphopantetheinyl transferase